MASVCPSHELEYALSNFAKVPSSCPTMVELDNTSTSIDRCQSDRVRKQRSLEGLTLMQPPTEPDATSQHDGSVCTRTRAMFRRSGLPPEASLTVWFLSVSLVWAVMLSESTFRHGRPKLGARTDKIVVPTKRSNTTVKWGWRMGQIVAVDRPCPHV